MQAPRRHAQRIAEVADDSGQKPIMPAGVQLSYCITAMRPIITSATRPTRLPVGSRCLTGPEIVKPGIAPWTICRQISKTKKNKAEDYPRSVLSAAFSRRPSNHGIWLLSCMPSFLYAQRR